MRQYAGYATRQGVQRALPLPARRTGSTGLSMAFDLPTQLGLDSDNPRCLGEVGRTGVAIDTIDDMRTAFDGIPLDQVSTSMTINAPAAVLLLLYELVGEEQGVAEREAARHDAERRAQGVHRARQLHLPAGADDAADDRPVRLLPRATSRSGTRSRSPATTSARRAARRVQEVAFTLCQRHRLRAGRDRRRPGRRRLRARAWPSSSTATTTSSRRSRSSAPPGGCGRTIMRERFGAQDPKLADAALPHADRRRDADRPAAGEQHRARRAAGLRRGLRRHAVAAHQRLRRGARAARPSAPRRSRCAPSRSSPTSRARPTPSTRSPAPTSSRR